MTWWRRRASVRVRTAAAAALVVGLALTAGALMLVGLLGRSFEAAAATSLDQRSADVVAAVGRSGAVGEEVREPGPAGEVVQLLDARGGLLGAVPPSVTRRLLEDLPRQGSVRRTTTTLTLAGTPGPALVLARWTADGVTGEPVLVVVARSLTAQHELLERLVGLLLVGLPLLLLVVVATAYVLVGRALGPVDTMRDEADRISARHLHTRLRVPPAQDEVHRLAVTINALLDRLEAAQQAQRRFVADAGHELRSPLATLTTTLEVASLAAGQGARTTVDDEAMLAEVRRMSAVVEDLLLLARADEHGLRLGVEDVDLDDLVDAEVRRLRGTTGLAVSVSVVPVRVRGDGARLARALRNLVDNAARHASSGVALSVREDGAHAVLAVDDDGPGIPAAQRDRVFERFVRLDDARGRVDGGSGLGLAIVREIVRGHDGTVTATSSDLGGARFVVTLPQAGPVDPSSSSR